MVYGNPMDPRTDVGTVITENAAKMFEKRLELTWSIIADNWIKNFLI